MKKEIIIPPQFQRPKTTIFFTAIKFLIAAFLIALPFKWFVAQPFVVSGASMLPTFDENEYLVIDKVSYHFEQPHRGDIIIFEYPLDPSYFFIKRIIGLPGETVVIERNGIKVKDNSGAEQLLTEPYASSLIKEESTTTLAKD